MAEKLSNVTMEGVRLIWRNFGGAEGQFNRAGDRNFAVVLDEDVALAMRADGWNIKQKAAREEGEPDLYTLGITVSYKGRPPRIVIITSKGRTTLSEDEVELLDWVDMANVDLIVNPYHWSVPGTGTGVKAYLHALYVTIQEDYLELKYNDVPEVGAIAAPQRPLEIEAPDGVIDVEWVEVDD